MRSSAVARRRQILFIEIAARVGGAYISDVHRGATAINPWREWARLEVGAGNQPYQLPAYASATTQA